MPKLLSLSYCLCLRSLSVSLFFISLHMRLYMTPLPAHDMILTWGVAPSLVRSFVLNLARMNALPTSHINSLMVLSDRLLLLLSPFPPSPPPCVYFQRPSHCSADRSQPVRSRSGQPRAARADGNGHQEEVPRNSAALPFQRPARRRRSAETTVAGASASSARGSPSTCSRRGSRVYCLCA